MDLNVRNEKKYWLMAERAWKIIEQNKMKAISKQRLMEEIKNSDWASFNLYRFTKKYI